MSVLDSVLGRRYSWDEIVKMFPDKWVALTEYEFKGADVTSGVLQAVCSDEKITENDTPLREKGLKKIYWRRTTDLPGNLLWVDW